MTETVTEIFTDQTREQAREIIARYPQSRSALLPMLHLVQSVEGYVSPRGVGFCAELLGLTKAEVGAVATFYTMYKRRPAGDWLVSVCTNTMCGVLGGDRAYQALQEYLGVGHDQTTEDGRITLEHAECLAACDDDRDGAVGEGPAGDETLAGNRLAAEHNVSVAGFDPNTPIGRKPAPAPPPPENLSGGPHTAAAGKKRSG